MLTETFILDPRYPDCTLTTYIHEPFAELNIPVRRAMIVCPGGGYEFLSDRESEPVALQYFAAGLNVFVLRYSVGDAAAYYAPLIEAALAVRHVRCHAADYHVDPAYVFISGFSAGGHVAASLCTKWKDPAVKEALGIPSSKVCRPTAGVLCYPVITGGRYAHRGSINRVTAGQEGSPEELIDRWSLEKQVDQDTCPAFIWHTYDDTCVPIQNTLLYASALAQAGVPFEYHVYPSGVHGLSLANGETSIGRADLDIPVVAAWINDAVRYCKQFKA